VLRDLDLGDSRIIRMLFRLRGLPEDGLHPEGVSRLGFEVLGRKLDDANALRNAEQARKGRDRWPE